MGSEAVVEVETVVAFLRQNGHGAAADLVRSEFLERRSSSGGMLSSTHIDVGAPRGGARKTTPRRSNSLPPTRDAAPEAPDGGAGAGAAAASAETRARRRLSASADAGAARDALEFAAAHSARAGAVPSPRSPAPGRGRAAAAAADDGFDLAFARATLGFTLELRRDASGDAARLVVTAVRDTCENAASLAAGDELVRVNRARVHVGVGINHWSRPAWDIFKALYLAQIELVFHDS